MQALIIVITMYLGGIVLPPIGKMINSPLLQEKLSLTNSQVEKMKAMWYPAEQTLIDLRAKREKIKLQIREEMGKENVDFDKLQKLFNDLSEVNAKISFTRAKMMVNIKKILTKDQLMKLRKMRINRIRRLLAARRKVRRFRPNPPALPPVIR